MIFLSFVILLAIAQLVLPRQWGFLPLIVAGCHLGNPEIIPQLTPARMLILLGCLRAIFGGFFVWPGKSRLDGIFIVFSIAAVLSSFGHVADQWFPSPMAARVGLILNTFGAYLYGRAYLPDISQFQRYASVLPLILIPLAAGLTFEKVTAQNVYHAVGAATAESISRQDRIRAAGPFRHPILAGTAGATAMPFALLLWMRGRRKSALLGGACCLAIVLASASSGPLAAVAVTIAAICLWRFRAKLHYFVWLGIALAAFYSIVAGRGPWYIMASIDLAGGSTGWHRAKLIDQGFYYFNEWWLCGTDYTRHWMSSGVRWNPNHIDLTNYYLHLGVTGGLALTLCLIAFIFVALRQLGRRTAEMRAVGDPDETVLWCAGAALAAHAISFISISYFDQMYIFFYILLGAIPGLVKAPPLAADGGSSVEVELGEDLPILGPERVGV